MKTEDSGVHACHVTNQMKTIITICSLIASLGALAQPAPNLSQTPQPTPYTAVDVGPHHTVWQRFEYEPSPSGNFVPHVHQYTELATGLHFWAHNQWNNTIEAIVPLPDGGAAATNGPHQVFFPANIYSGAIELVAPDGVHLKSRPIGIAYANGTNSVMIATLTNSIGQLLPSGNQIIYTNAFATASEGAGATGVNADLVLTYRKSGVECDLVFRSKPPGPDAWNMDPDDVHTRIGLWTEFFDTQEPATVSTNTSDEDGLTDNTLKFGANTLMVPGKTFTVGTGSPGAQASVYKSWIQNIDGGRTVLVEEMPYCRLKGQLDELASLDKKSDRLYASAASHRATERPSGLGLRKSTKPRAALSTASSSPRSAAAPHGPFKLQLPPRRGVAQTSGQTVLLAKTDLARRPGVWADYTTVSGTQTNYLFAGNTTYYISSTLSLCGTNTWEKGTILKFAQNASINIVSGPLTPQLVFTSTAYDPVVFTCVDDSSLGEAIGTNSPGGYYANPVLNLQSVGNQSFSNVRFLYAQQGISLGSGSLTNYDCQFVNCQNGYALSSATLQLGNCLFANIQTNFSSSGAVTVVAENATFSGSSNVISTLSSTNTSAFHLTNCILAGINALTNGSVTLDGAFNGFYNSTQFGSGALTSTVYPFVTVGAGSFYLADDSLQPFRNAGTTNIDPALLADLAEKTTYPPIVYSNVTLSTATTLSPQVQKDTSIPTLGYHYDPIDFLTDVLAVTNAALTIAPGSAIACFNQAGIWLQDGSSLVSVGTPRTPNWFTYYLSVQEQPISIDTGGFYGAQNVTAYHYGPTGPNGFFRFSHFSRPAGTGYVFTHEMTWSYNSLWVQDCELWNGQNYFQGNTNTTATVKNNLFYRSPVSASGSSYPSVLSVSNNLVLGGSVAIIPGSSNAVWTVFDNDFDTCSFSRFGGGSSNGFNAYIKCTNRLTPTNANDIVLTNSIAYESGALGGFYQPTNSPLLNMGSTTANLDGLYHYTVLTNETKEANSVVTIGYHYVAVDTNGVPISTPNDTIADYFADSNGDGIFDSGDFCNWQTYTSPNGLTPGNALLVFTPLK